jgi:hypothetical protein
MTIVAEKMILTVTLFDSLLVHSVVLVRGPNLREADFHADKTQRFTQ